MVYTNFVVHGANPIDLGLWRAEKAVTLYHNTPRNRNPVITLTGRDEARALAEIVLKSNVKETDIRVEEKSRTTGENVFYLGKDVLPGLDREFGNCEGLYYISQKWHEGRVLYCARRLLDIRQCPYGFIPADDRREPKEIQRSKRNEWINLLADMLALDFLHRLGVPVPSAYTLILKSVAPERA